MEMKREDFMSCAGDVTFEMKEIQKEDINEVQAPDITASTQFFTIFCCSKAKSKMFFGILLFYILQ